MGPSLLPALVLLAAGPTAAPSHAARATPAILADAPVAAPAMPEVREPTPAQLRKEADESSVEMKAALKKLLGMIEKARAERDIVLLNCLNEKLAQTKALVRVSDQANLNLQEFLARDQLEGAIHERRKIFLAEEKVKGLLAEAEMCLGEKGSSGAKTTVSVEKPDYGGDPTHLDQNPEEPTDETPPSASPYN